MNFVLDPKCTQCDSDVVYISECDCHIYLRMFISECLSQECDRMWSTQCDSMWYICNVTVRISHVVIEEC